LLFLLAIIELQVLTLGYRRFLRCCDSRAPVFVSLSFTAKAAIQRLPIKNKHSHNYNVACRLAVANNGVAGIERNRNAPAASRFNP
jgi:hypothetical protein